MNKPCAAGAAGLAALLSLGATSVVAAADLVSYAPPTAAAQAQYSTDYTTYGDIWTGFYAGAHLGGVTTDDFAETNSAWQGGVQAGYTHQFGAFVLGAEAAASLNDGLYYELEPGAGLTQDWNVALKGKAGLALDNTLIYATGGVSIAELTPSGAVSSPAETHVGATFGGGIEQAIGNGFSLRAEYEQTRFFDVASSVGGTGRTDEFTNHAVKLGVNYRF